MFRKKRQLEREVPSPDKAPAPLDYRNPADDPKSAADDFLDPKANAKALGNFVLGFIGEAFAHIVVFAVIVGIIWLGARGCWD